jgi:hypothetical protein
MATFVKFNKFLEHLAEKNHNLGADALKIALTNTAPTMATDVTFDAVTDHAAPAEAHGYTSGGHAVTVDASSEAGGTYTLACTTAVVITASGGTIGPFRYVILYNSTPATNNLIACWDYGSSITLADGEKFTATPAGSLLTLV